LDGKVVEKDLSLLFDDLLEVIGNSPVVLLSLISWDVVAVVVLASSPRNNVNGGLDAFFFAFACVVRRIDFLKPKSNGNEI
jgi:hypothetical protein